MENITSYNGIDFTDFLNNINLLYSDASEASSKGDGQSVQNCLTMAFGMKSAFISLFGDKFDIVKNPYSKEKEYVVIVEL